MKRLRLGGKRANGRYVIFDDQDYELVSQYSWSFSARGYAITSVFGKTTLMHRMIMSPPDGSVIDHINNNGLDNRRSNIRICNYSQNLIRSKKRKNVSSAYKGVCFRPTAKHKIWRCNVGGTELGSFNTEIEAAKAYDERVKTIYGEFALLNFPHG